jgi:Skp family chaperone for outer membrane proteins
VFKKINPSIVLTALILLPVFIKGEVKVGFVQSDRIRMEYEDFKEAETQLQLEFQKVQFEYQEMLSQLDSLKGKGLITEDDYEIKKKEITDR